MSGKASSRASTNVQLNVDMSLVLEFSTNRGVVAHFRRNYLLR